MDSTDGNRPAWKQAAPWIAPASVLLTVAVIAIITAIISYEHEYELASRNGQDAWIARLVPFSVDGMIVVASVALLWAASHEIRGPRQLWRPVVVLVVGIGATIAANMFSDLHYWWLGPAVAASSGVALILISDIAFWMIGIQRKLMSGQPVMPAQQAPNCDHPPAAVSLAEALPVARAELIGRGEKHGEEQLAARFGVTRHQVRLSLAAAGAAGAEQSQSPPPATVPAASNGHRRA